MKVRYPTMDFSTVRAHWAKVPEFAQSYNAFSTVPAHVEPYLIKVMNRAKKELPAEYTQLHEDIDVFNKQEVQHCKQHLAFNKRLYELGYEGVADLEIPYKNDYEDFLKTKSLRFNIAYCEGFEAMGSASAAVYFEDLADYLDGADDTVVNLWKWHLAEEYEHRNVCADVYSSLYGRGVIAYFYRLWGFVYATKHIGSHVQRVTQYLYARDRETMSEAELAASLKREKALSKKVARASLKRLRMVFSPFYDPGKREPSPGMAEILAMYPDTRNG